MNTTLGTAYMVGKKKWGFFFSRDFSCAAT